MSCADDPVPLPDAIIAARSARLAAVAEAARRGNPPVYVIGTEVPVPGGALEVVEHLTLTTARRRPRHRRHPRATPLPAAGIEPPSPASSALSCNRVSSSAMKTWSPTTPTPPAIWSPSSTTCRCCMRRIRPTTRPPQALAALVRDGFAILKVGPGLTFALREALYGLDHIADLLFPDRPARLRAHDGAGDADQPRQLGEILSRHARITSTCNAITAIPTASAITGPIRWRSRPSPI